MKIKKSLGQNFFINENLGRRIVDFVKSQSPDLIVEIGPGRGFFTQKLAEIASNLVLIEKDDLLSQNLKEMFPNTKVLNKDFLDWNFEELAPFVNQKIVFFGSLPYNVSKPIIHKILESKFFNGNCYFIIQREVAEKYIAQPPNSNVLSIKTQLFAKPKKLMDIHPGSFLPQPKVTSSLIQFSPIPRNPQIVDTHLFIHFVENCFRSPRKTLRNNLKNTTLDPEFEELFSKRPQELSIEQYIQIFTNLP